MVMAHQIDLFCVPHPADTPCLKAGHNGGYVRGLPSAGRLQSVIRVSARGHARRPDDHLRSSAQPGGADALVALAANLVGRRLVVPACLIVA